MATQDIPRVLFTFEVGREAPSDISITRAIVDFMVSDACPDVVRNEKIWIESLLFHGVKLLLITAFVHNGAGEQPSDVPIHDTWSETIKGAFVLTIKVQVKPNDDA